MTYRLYGSQIKTIKKRVSSVTAALVLAFTSLGITPLLSATASAVTGPEVVYNALPSNNPANTNYTSLGNEAYSVSEFGDYVHLGATNRILNTVTVTLSDWAKYSDYSSDETYSGNSSTWSMPMTLNIYSNSLDSNGVPDTLLASTNQTVTIPWRPAGDSSCGLTSNGYGWKIGNTCYNWSGIASNATFDLSSLNVTLPSDVIISVAYNTQHHGYNPTGAAGPYDSLNIAIPSGQTATVGSDNSSDKLFLSSTWNGIYSDNGDGGIGIFRQDAGWTPYGTVAFMVTATTLDAPANLTLKTTPGNVTLANNGYTDSYGVTASWDPVPGADHYMYKYWNDISSSPYNAANPYIVSTPATTLSGVFNQGEGLHHVAVSACDASNLCSAYSTQFNVTYDITKPTITIKTTAGVNDGTLGSDPYSRISFKLHDNSALKEVVLNGHSYLRGGTWNDLNWQNITKSQLIAGLNTVVVRDQAGNESQLTFTYDNTAPDQPILVSPADNSVVKGASITQIWSDASSDVNHYIYESYNDASAASLRWHQEFTDTNKTATNVGEASYWWRVKAVDNAGNESAWSDLWKITVDNTSPTITVKSNFVGDDTAKIFSNVSFQLFDAHQVDKYVLNGWASDFTNNSWSDANFQNIKSHLNEGNNIFTLYDLAGNSTAYAFTYDSIAPLTAIDSYIGTDTTPTITGTTDDPTAHINVSIDGTTAEVATNNGDGTWSLTVRSDLGVGSHTVSVAATDIAGNSSSTTAAITVTAPTTPVSNPTVVITPNNDGGQALGAQTTTPNVTTTIEESTDPDENSGEVEGASTTSDTAGLSTDNSDTTQNSNFLGLGWWWLLVVALLGFFWLLFGKRKKQDDK